MSFLLTSVAVTSPVVTMVTHAAGTNGGEEEVTDDKRAEEERKREEERIANEKRMKEIASKVVQIEYKDESTFRHEMTEKLLHDLPFEILEMYHEVDGKIIIVDGSLVEHPDLKDRQIESLDRLYVYSTNETGLKVFIRATDEYEVNVALKTNVYSEIGRSLVRGVLKPEVLTNSAFLNAVNQMQLEADMEVVFFTQSLREHEGLFDEAYVKEHMEDFQNVFAKAFAFYELPEWKSYLKEYAPDMFNYFDKMDWGKLKEQVQKEEPLDFKDDTATALGWAQDNYGDWYTKLNRLQQAAITGYLRQDYRLINPYLWNKDPEKVIDTELEEKIDNIQQALSSKLLPQDLIVYRRMGATEYDLKVDDPAYNFNIPENVATFREKWEGKEKENLGFLSTTILNSGAGQMAPRKLILRLQVPKGTHGAYVNFTDAQYGGEYEFLISDGYKYKINKISEIKEGTQIKLLIDASLIPKSTDNTMLN